MPHVECRRHADRLPKRPVQVFLYSGDGVEPPHVHVERDEKIAKFWLRPVRLQESDGFNRVEIGRLQGIVEENLETLLRSWEAYFGS